MTTDVPAVAPDGRVPSAAFHAFMGQWQRLVLTMPVTRAWSEARAIILYDDAATGYVGTATVGNACF